LLRNVLPVVDEDGIQYPANIFDHHRLRADFVNDSDHRGEQVPIVAVTELFAGDRKRRTWQAA
jgi:hypothetical protein